MISRRAVWWLVVALIGGCAERERVTFPTDTGNNGDGAGPVTSIDEPGASDTVLVEGDRFVLSGRTVDPDGVDTVYFDVNGLDVSFAPLRGGGADTVSFGLPLSTLGFSGVTVLVRIHGVDMLGNVGQTVSRQLHIQ
jgi:hypothetical protein